MNVWRDMQAPLVASLVTTVDGQGRPNASPKTWWTPASYDPPLVALCVKPQSDTARNLAETGTFVLHLPSVLEARQVLHTAKPLPHGDCELDDVGLPWEWMEHQLLPHPMPKVKGMPFVAVWLTNAMQLGDHVMFVGQVGVAGGFDREVGVEAVLLHRGQNVFVAMGPEFEVERY